MTFNVEEVAPAARLRPELRCWQGRWAGRILVWRTPCGTLYIGPHWPCSVVMLCIIYWMGMQGFHKASEDDDMDKKRMALTALSTLLFLLCALRNPGIFEADGSQVILAVEGGMAALPRRWCDVCRHERLEKVEHCPFCQVCVEGLDHHCPWMGKCIGKKNLCNFYSFLCVSFASLAYIYAVV